MKMCRVFLAGVLMVVTARGLLLGATDEEVELLPGYEFGVERLNPEFVRYLHDVLALNLVIGGNNAIVNNDSVEWVEWFLRVVMRYVESIEWFCEEFSGLKHE